MLRVEVRQTLAFIDMFSLRRVADTCWANLSFCLADPFFIRQQIVSLRDEGLLRFGNTGWVWDADELEGMHDDVFDNVVVMLSEKWRSSLC